MLRKLKAGDEVFAVFANALGKGDHGYCVKVVRIGRKWAYIERFNREMAFDPETGKCKSDSYPEFDVFNDRTEYDRMRYEAQVRIRLRKRLCTSFATLVVMPTECVDKLHRVLDEFKINMEEK